MNLEGFPREVVSEGGGNGETQHKSVFRESGYNGDLKGPVRHHPTSLEFPVDAESRCRVLLPLVHGDQHKPLPRHPGACREGEALSSWEPSVIHTWGW